MPVVKLRSALKRNEADAIAAFWMRQSEEIQHFISRFENHSIVVQRKGMWVLGIIHEMDSQALLPFHDSIFNIFSCSNDPAVRREIFGMLLNTEDEKIRGKMLDAAMLSLHNPMSSVAECHHALQWLIEPSKKHPEIGNETISALIATQDLRTAAWSRYAKKQIIYLQKKMSNTNG